MSQSVKKSTRINKVKAFSKECKYIILLNLLSFFISCCIFYSGFNWYNVLPVFLSLGSLVWFISKTDELMDKENDSFKFAPYFFMTFHYLLIMLYSIALSPLKPDNCNLSIHIISNLLLVSTNTLFAFVISKIADQLIFKEDKERIEKAVRGEIIDSNYKNKNLRKILTSIFAMLSPTFWTSTSIHQIITNKYLMNYINEQLQRINLINMTYALPFIIFVLLMVFVISSISKHRLTFLFYMLEVCFFVHFLFHSLPNLMFEEINPFLLSFLIIIIVFLILFSPFLFLSIYLLHLCYMIYDDNLNTELTYKGIQEKMKRKLIDYSISVFDKQDIFSELLNTNDNMLKRMTDNIEISYNVSNRLKEIGYFEKNLSWKIKELKIIKNNLKFFSIMDIKIKEFLKSIITTAVWIFSLISLIALINEINLFGKCIDVFGIQFHITESLVFWSTLTCATALLLFCHFGTFYYSLSQKNNRFKETLNTIDIVLDNIILELEEAKNNQNQIHKIPIRRLRNFSTKRL